MIILLIATLIKGAAILILGLQIIIKVKMLMNQIDKLKIIIFTHNISTYTNIKKEKWISFVDLQTIVIVKNLFINIQTNKKTTRSSRTHANNDPNNRQRREDKIQTTMSHPRLYKGKGLLWHTFWSMLFLAVFKGYYPFKNPPQDTGRLTFKRKQWNNGMIKIVMIMIVIS